MIFNFTSTDKLLSEISLRIYPVGSVYMSTNNTSPQTLFGGTWERIEDRFLLSAGTNHAVGSTGGSENATLVSHSHTFTGTAQEHVHGMDHKHSHEHTHVGPTHNHSVGAHSHGLNNHTHSVGAHSHGLNSHTHNVSGGAFVTADNTVSKTQLKQGTNTTTNYFLNVASATSVNRASATSGASGSTANSTAFNTGGNSGSTANSTAFNTGSGGGGNTGEPSYPWTGSPLDFISSMAKTNTDKTSLTPSGTISTNGNSATGANMPPYLTVYMWKRTA